MVKKYNLEPLDVVPYSARHSRATIDLVTGVQLVDGETRLFVYEGQPASFEPLNAMGRLMKMLERKQPNSNTAFTLMNSSITFPARLYNSFEMPTKLIKLRAPLPQLLLRSVTGPKPAPSPRPCHSAAQLSGAAV